MKLPHKQFILSHLFQNSLIGHHVGIKLYQQAFCVIHHLTVIGIWFHTTRITDNAPSNSVQPYVFGKHKANQYGEFVVWYLVVVACFNKIHLLFELKLRPPKSSTGYNGQLVSRPFRCQRQFRANVMCHTIALMKPTTACHVLTTSDVCCFSEMISHPKSAR